MEKDAVSRRNARQRLQDESGLLWLQPGDDHILRRQLVLGQPRRCRGGQRQVAVLSRPPRHGRRARVAAAADRHDGPPLQPGARF